MKHPLRHDLISLFAFTLFLIHSSASAAIQFSEACRPGQQITIGAVGDVLLHSPLQKQAARNLKQGRFTTLWKMTEPLLTQADLAYANFEGPAAYGLPLGSYPAFNYHPSLIEDLISSGIKIVSTANNHALDRSSVGIDRTIEMMDRYGLPFTGTRSTLDLKRPWMTVTHQGGFSIAWIACTYGTNGIPDRKSQVLYCYQDAQEIESLIHSASQDKSIDAVIVTPHWGQEYEHKPEPAQKKLATRFFKAGALAIIGSHPHVLQPWEKVEVDGKERFVIYSLGNFVSGQTSLAKRTTLLLYLGLSRDGNGNVWINGVRNVPLYMQAGNGLFSVEPMDQTPAPAAALALVRKLFGTENEMDSRDRVVTNPECQ